MIQVLIANDERAASSILERLIDRSSDMTCVGRASNGEEAIRMAQALRPDIVLMDLMMPHINGIEATKQIKATVPKTQIVVNTARSDYQDRAIEAGASVVLTIPISHETILETIRDVISSTKNDYLTQ
jgi:two-component system, NarL family, response regulator DesR